MNAFFALVVPKLFAHRRAVLLCAAALFLLFGLTLARARLKESITTFLPRDTALLEQFQAFTLTPAARFIFIELSAARPEDRDKLPQAAKTARDLLKAPLFGAVHPAPGIPAAPALLDLVPSLFRAGNLERFTASATGGDLPKHLRLLRDRLLGPEGMVLKLFIPHDPLGLLAVLPQRIMECGLAGSPSGPSSGKDAGGTGSLAGLQALALSGGLPSPGGDALLLFAESPRHAMDSADALAVAQALDALRPAMPRGVAVNVLSAYQHTAANVRTIKADTLRVLIASTLALAVIFLVWLRTLSSLPVFAMPCAALLAAWGLLALAGAEISGITIGFGAVLLGIVVDYALHIHCAVRAGIAPQDAPAALARPLLFSFLTTAAAVGALFCSNLPGMRQVGLFSLLGCGAGLFLALFLLPLLQKPRPADPALCASLCPEPGRAPLRLALRPLPCLLFAAALALCLLAGRNLRLEADMRALGVRDPALARAEEQLAARWGKDLRQTAMLVNSGPTLPDALTAQDAALRALRAAYAERKLPDRPSTLLPLLPAPQEQAENRAHWDAFVAASGPALRAALGPDGAAAALGFSPTAFAPFLARLDAPPKPLDPAALDRAGLGLFRAMFLPPQDLTPGAPSVLAFLPDRPELFARLQPELPSGSLLFSPDGVRERISQAVRGDFLRMGLAALVAVTLCIFAAQRSAASTFLALIPSLAGSGALLLIFGLRETPLNLFSVAALPLVIGLSAQYGIFMTRHAARRIAPSTPRAILLSGLTTLTGFGSLILADHPALHSLGLTVAAGMGAALPAALWLLPWAARREE